VRFVARGDPSASDAIAVLDDRANLPGRGAYVCRARSGSLPARACLERAIRRGGFARTLRARVTVDPKIVESVGR
jgi:predicted RNA-binding protein YlxR (DUF448 family)